MGAVLRLGMAIAAAGLWLGQSPALAQTAPAPTTNTPATESIGPRELQNFSLQGNVTRPADQAPANQPAATRPVRTPSSRPGEQAQARPVRAAGTSQPRAEAAAPTPPPPAPVAETTAVVPEPAAASLPPAPDETAPRIEPEHSLTIWPWLLAALALGVGGAYLYRRRSSREAYAGVHDVEAFAAPEPEAAPRAPTPPPPTSAPEPHARPKPIGLVSTRMRPWVEIGFTPVNCLVEDERITFEFELELFNSGNAPARDVLAEINMFNASPRQDEEIGQFFAKPMGHGDRIQIIPALQRVSLRPKVTILREQVQVLEAGGRQFFVPLMAFNALYRWGGGEGQTSAAYLLGRDTKGEKLGPFRIDLGVRMFPKVGARPLPLGVRN